MGDTTKKGGILGHYNFRYLELDSVKGRLKRFLSTKDYPKKPKVVIDIKNFKLIKKQKLIKDYYDLEITYTESNQKGVFVIKNVVINGSNLYYLYGKL